MDNSNNTFTETTSTSWFSRILRSIAGVFFGFILILAMIVLLFWNEGRAVTTARSLAEGATSVVSVGSDRIDPANEGKLVYTTGAVKVSGELVDPAFGITATGVRLVRNVEMYQWKEESHSETTKKLGGGEETTTTYSYSRDWSSKAIDSSDFKVPGGHENPPMEVSGTSIQTPSAEFGAFTLNDNVLSAISDSQPLTVTDQQKAAIQAALGEGGRPVHVAFGKIVLGQNTSSPQLGDMRVGYDLVPAGPISIVAKQSGSSFSGYQTSAGDELQLVESGTVPVDQMFAHAESTNTMITWLIRVGGFALLFIGFALVLAPLSVVADIIPFVGNLVGLGTGLIAFVFAVGVSAVTISIAWFFYRPLLAVGILVVGGAIAFAIGALIKKRAAARGAAPASSTAAAA